MDLQEYNYGRCGVFCEMCATGNGRIATLAVELQRLTQKQYGWAQDTVNFQFEEVAKGLEWFSKQDCPGCQSVQEPWCEVLKCEKSATLPSCLVCEDFMTCERTEYQRDRYPFVIEHHKRVKQIGLAQLYAEERKKAQTGVLLHDIRKW